LHHALPLPAYCSMCGQAAALFLVGHLASMLPVP